METWGFLVVGDWEAEELLALVWWSQCFMADWTARGVCQRLSEEEWKVARGADDLLEEGLDFWTGVEMWEKRVSFDGPSALTVAVQRQVGGFVSGTWIFEDVAVVDQR